MTVHVRSTAWSFHTETSYPPLPQEPRAQATSSRAGATVILPPPRGLADVSLAAALAGRISCRSFAGAPLTLQEVSTILDAAYGDHGDANGSRGDRLGLRPVPSAGARYPLEIHLIASSIDALERCTYRYVPSRHCLVCTEGLVAPEAVAELFLGQPFLAAASALAVVTARLGSSLQRYGDRGYRYVLFEAGHVAQNLNLASSALQLGSLNLGGFWDRALGRALGLIDQVPLYGVALGRTPPTDIHTVRQPPGEDLQQRE